MKARELDLTASIARAQNQTRSAATAGAQREFPDHHVREGEIVVEGGPLSAEDSDPSRSAIELLRKLGFGKQQQEWPSPFFGPVLPDVLEQLKRAHQILTTRGFVFVGDPLNPLGDGKSWVLKCEPPIGLPNDSDPARLAHRCLQKEGIKVATRPVLDGETLLIPLWDSGKGPAAETESTDSENADGVQHKVAAGSQRELLRFVRRGDRIVVASCKYMETAVANTCEAFIPYMRQVKSIVRSGGEKLTVTELRRRFKNTNFIKALDDEDWQMLIDEFSHRRSAGPRNLTVALLARRTGLSIETVATYTRPSRKRKKAARR